MNLQIIIPSHKRANGVTSKKLFDNCILCVPKSQEDEYRNFNPDVEIVTHPDSIIGISAKNQWILEKFKDVFIIDDDIRKAIKVYVNPNRKNVNTELTREELKDVIFSLAYMAKDFKCFLFGLSNSPNPLRYSPFQPFSFTGGICNGGKGVLSGSKIHFSKEMLIGEDQYISCVNAYYNRYCLMDNRFALVGGEMARKTGGCSDIRNVQVEKETYYFLKKKFGSAIRLKSVNPFKRYNNKHKFENVVKIPF